MKHAFIGVLIGTGVALILPTWASIVLQAGLILWLIKEARA